MVAIVFLTVLVSIILAVSTANLRMKQIEYRAKGNFYRNEQVLDDVYHGIGKDATQCLTKAYAAILAQTAMDGGAPVYQTEGEAYRAFSGNFMARLLELFPEGAQTHDALERLNNYALYTLVPVKVRSYEKVEVEKDDDGIPVQLVISKIKADFKETDSAGSATGFESTITTDIVIEVPYVTFFEDSSKIMDYALIGNKGVYFNGGGRDVTGNIYAGTDDAEPAANIAVYRNEDVPGGLNFYGADTEITAGFVISKGDITIRKSSLKAGIDAESAAKIQIWAETVRTAEDASKNTPAEPNTVELDGQIFLANDLELNARESHVTLKGEFYGYNNGIYATREKKNLSGSYQTSAHTQSSSVIINGNSSYLDLTGLTTFVVAGNAYIDLADSSFPDGGTAGTEEYATGESLALKANQYLYLAPADCLTGMNPYMEGGAPTLWAEGSSWFAYDKGYINSAEPLVEKTYGRNGNKYHYYYLNFISESKKTEYAQLVLNMTEPANMAAEMSPEILAMYEDFNELELEQIWELKQEISGKAMADSVRSTIETADGTAARSYTKGAVVRVSGGKESAQILEDDQKLSVDYIGKVENNLLKHYQHFCVSLDPKEEFSLLSDALPSVSDSEMEDGTRPLSIYADLTALPAGTGGYEYSCQGKYGKCRTVLSGGDCTISADLSGIVICGGDVTVKNGVNVEGLILAGGRIYIEGNGKLEAGRSAVQAILEEEYTLEREKEAVEVKNPSFASTYLTDYTPKRMGAAYKERVTGTDYTDYISYRNWKKGDED